MSTTASMPAAPAQASPQKRVTDLSAALIGSWQTGYLKDRSGAVSALARLRRGAGRPAGETPDLWNLIDIGPLHNPAEGTGPLSEQELEQAENALHAVLALWAFHQQSRGVPMHRRHTREHPGGLGAAVRRLMPTDGTDAPVRKRLVRAGTAPDLATLTQRLRDIVALLRSAKTPIPLDYALLAGQLYVWQRPGGPAAVRRAWGRSFHQQPQTRPDPGENTAPALSSDEQTIPDSDKDAS